MPPAAPTCTSVVLTQSYTWSHELHELRASPSTLQAAGITRAFEWLLLGGMIPCLATVEVGVPDYSVVAPAWMARQLQATLGKTYVRLEQHPDKLRAGSRPSAKWVTFEQVGHANAAQCDGIDSDNEDDVYDHFDYGDEGTELATEQFELHATKQPWDAAGARALQRQLVNVPLIVGTRCAVQRMCGVGVIRVVSMDGGVECLSACVAPGTCIEVHASTLGKQRVAVASPCDGHGDAAVAELYAHGAALLEPARLRAAGSTGKDNDEVTGLSSSARDCSIVGSSRDASSGAKATVALALKCGHGLLYGPPGIGKHRAVHRAAYWLRERHGAALVRVSTARMLAAAEAGILECAVDKTFRKARERAPSVVIIEDLRLLEQEHDVALVDVSRDSCNHGGQEQARAVQLKVAFELQARLCAAPPGVLAFGCCIDPLALPICLRMHGAFAFLRALAAPSAVERMQIIANMLPVGAADPGMPARAGVEEDDMPLTARQHAPLLARATANYSVRDIRRVMFGVYTLANHRVRLPTWHDANEALASSAPLDSADSSESLLSPSRFRRPRLGEGEQVTVPSMGDGQASKYGGLGYSAIEGFGGYYAVRDRFERLLRLHAQCCFAAERDGSIKGTTDGRVIDHRTMGVLKPPSGILLYGPPGNGKTLLAKQLGTTLGWPVISANVAQLFGRYVGETEANIRAIFRRARTRSPSVLLLDEIDAIGVGRGAPNNPSSSAAMCMSSAAERALSTLLNEMDGVGFAEAAGTSLGSSLDEDVMGSDTVRHAVFLVGCTNRPDLVDAALLRPGRLERLIHVRNPDLVDAVHVLRLRMDGLPVEPGIDLALVAAAAAGFSCAQLSSVVTEAGLQAMARAWRACSHYCDDAVETSKADDGVLHHVNSNNIDENDNHEDDDDNDDNDDNDDDDDNDDYGLWAAEQHIFGESYSREEQDVRWCTVQEKCLSVLITQCDLMRAVKIVWKRQALYMALCEARGLGRLYEDFEHSHGACD